MSKKKKEDPKLHFMVAQEQGLEYMQPDIKEEEEEMKDESVSAGEFREFKDSTNKQFETLNKNVEKLDGRMWGVLITAITGLIAIIVGFIAVINTITSTLINIFGG